MSGPGIATGLIDQGAHSPDQLIAGEFPRINRLVTVTGDAPLPAGSVLGRESATGLYVLSDSRATDGSEIPDVILAEPVDVTESNAQAYAWFTGEFNATALTMGAGHTIDSIAQAFRQRSLFLRHIQP
mgnify:FL=1